MSTTAKAGGRRLSEDALFHRGRGLDLEAACFHGARQPGEEGAVVIDDQERVVRERAEICLGHGQTC